MDQLAKTIFGQDNINILEAQETLDQLAAQISATN